MNIFISHSSKDKWAARRISDDLISFGIVTFLDEKDIETGESIDNSIKKNLKECDDFLIILSPASIKSKWVLIELGGALALEKKIIPILLYVGANEMPKIINLRLARDINSINLYYEEVKQIISGNKVKKTSPQIKPSNYVFKIGSKVAVVPHKPQDVMRDNALIDWEPEMDKYLGMETEVLNFESTGISDAYSLLDAPSSSGRYFVFAKEWLTPIK